jgi:protein arginine N-methyltransferase 5
MLEVAYAAFCGISYLLIPGPKLQHGNLHSEGLIYYARAIQESMNIAPYIQFHIWLGMIESSELETTQMGDLSPFARTEFLDPSEDRTAKIDLFGTWDAWEIIRTTCKHHSRLLVGKNTY